MSSTFTPTKQKRPKRFNRNNLPPSEEEALARIHDLNAEASSVAAKLTNANPKNYPSQGDYQDWRHRAGIRLNCSHEEISFLQMWLSGRQQTDRRLELGQREDDVPRELDPVSRRALELAQEIELRYTPMYTNRTQPIDAHTAKQRLGHLQLVRHQIRVAFSEVGTMIADRPLLQSDIPKVKAPLHVLLIKVAAEMTAVKLYIRNQNTAVAASNTGKPSSWQNRALRALTRFVAQGFVLIEDEQELFRYLQEKTKE
jgi:hypothetical protein